MQFPLCLLPSQHGKPLYTTNDLAEELNPDYMLQIDAGDIMGKTLKNLSFQDITKSSSYYKTIFSPRHMDGISSCTTSTGLTIDMSGGRKNFTLDDYISRVLLEHPYAVIALADETPFSSGYKRLAKAAERSTKWFQQFITKTKQLPNMQVLGVVNGGMREEAMVELAKKLLAGGASGLVVGGAGSGETPQDRSQAVRTLRQVLDEQTNDRRLLLVVQCMNSLPEVMHCLSLGVDVVGTAYPERITSAGIACVSCLPVVESASLVSDLDESTTPAAKKARVTLPDSFVETTINLFDASYARDKSPIMTGCQCHACRNFSRAYIHHLLIAHELLGEVLLYAHNQHHVLKIFEVSRKLIQEKSFGGWVEQYLVANFL